MTRSQVAVAYCTPLAMTAESSSLASLAIKYRGQGKAIYRNQHLVREIASVTLFLAMTAKVEIASPCLHKFSKQALARNDDLVVYYSKTNKKFLDYNPSMDIVRKESLEHLNNLKHKKLIKVVTGIRRCGKSTLLQMFRDSLISDGVKTREIVFINFEDYENKALRNPDKLYTYITSRLTSSMNYVFLDEVEHVQNFPDVVDALYIKDNVDLYITGSNSSLLSSELATLISGRYVEIKLLPLSFKEFVEATGQHENLTKAYRQYVATSSFPYVLELLNTPQEIDSYLEGIYNTILVKDIMDRKKISDTLILKSVTEFLFDNIGLEVSPKKIADTLTSSNRKSDPKTIEKYITSLEECFVIYCAKRYNITGKSTIWWWTL